MAYIKPVCFFLCFFCFAVKSLLANDSIIVKKDARLEILSAKQAYINKRSAMLTSNGLFKGYRLQLVSTTSRDKAQRIKTDMMNKFPEQKTYLMYQSPNFRVRIGNFIKKEEANQFRKQLIKYFPNGVYIVEDGIEYTPKDEDIF